MQVIQCKIHKIEFQLPSTEDEFVSGELHEQIECLCEHHDCYPDCRFKEVQK